MLAIVFACEHFRQMLYGTRFEVVTDHQPLKALLTSYTISPRLYRWKSRIEMFDMEIQYREGKKHGNADESSRMAVDEEEVDIEEEPWRQIPINSVCVEEEILESDEEISDSRSWKQSM
jgi:hypothetical protein